MCVCGVCVCVCRCVCILPFAMTKHSSGILGSGRVYGTYGGGPAMHRMLSPFQQPADTTQASKHPRHGRRRCFDRTRETSPFCDLLPGARARAVCASVCSHGVTGGGALVLQVEANVQPVHMFFSRFAAGDKVLSAACREGGLSLDRGRLVGSPERLNLFTMDGDLLRVDLELDVSRDAHCVA